MSSTVSFSPAAAAEAGSPRGSGTDAYVSGSSSRRQWEYGQAITTALPTTSSSGMVPFPGSSKW